MCAIRLSRSSMTTAHQRPGGHVTNFARFARSPSVLNTSSIFAHHNDQIESGIEMDELGLAMLSSSERRPIHEDGPNSLGLCANTSRRTAPRCSCTSPLHCGKEQSSAFPCDAANTIRVTLQTNVPLCKESFTQITISDLHGAVHEDGDVSLSGVDSLTYAAYPGGPAVTAGGYYRMIPPVLPSSSCT